MWYREVKEGLTTWDRLVAQGMALPTMPRIYRQDVPYKAPYFNEHGFLQLDLRPEHIGKTRLDLQRIMRCKEPVN